MTEIQGKSILVRVNARFELARVRVIESRLFDKKGCRGSFHCKRSLIYFTQLNTLKHSTELFFLVITKSA